MPHFDAQECSPVLFAALDCDHAFCLTCLREWRGTLNMDSAATHSCPLCRTVTYFVTPSSEWVTSGPYKTSVIQGYRDRLSKMPCKYFSEGRGTCPFGTSCFYAHILPDGSREQVQLRTLLDDDENVRVMQTVRLSDFLFAADRRRS